MLKRKLNLRSLHLKDIPVKEKIKKEIDDYDDNILTEQQKSLSRSSIETSSYFPTPFWKIFFYLECQLNIRLKSLKPPASIKVIYNPLEYAAEIHCAYLRKFLSGPKHIMFIGMNPGPNGMSQTGVPFGNVTTVRDLMNLSGKVQQPATVHPKRPITGMQCTIDEPSGVRIWNLLKKLANGSLETFSQHCFVHNFCPLAFHDDWGHNITPSELKGDEFKTNLRNICLQTLDEEIKMVQPEIVIAVGEYVFAAMKKSAHFKNLQVLRLPHPSPRSLNNTNWPEKAEVFFIENDLIKFLRNELT